MASQPAELKHYAVTAKEKIEICLYKEQNPKGNCAEFEATVVSQCDSLIEAIKKRKSELLESVQVEKENKLKTLKEQASHCTALLQRTTGLLQFCIEVLKESNPSSFLQVVYVGWDTTCTVDGLHFHSIYNPQVKAHNHAGESLYTDLVSLQPAEGKDDKVWSIYIYYQRIWFIH